MSIKSDVLIESKSLRESVIDRIDVLERVKNLELLADDIHATVEMAANYYDVKPEVIRQLAVRKKIELESDGMKNLRGSELSDIKSLCGLSPNIGRLMVFPRRALLRMGMLLEESEVAKEVRTMLLDKEQESHNLQQANIVQIPTELNILGQIIESNNQTFKVLLQMQSQVNETSMIATSANERAIAAEEKAKNAQKENETLKQELDDIRKGLVDVEVPLRTQFNDAARKYAKRNGLEWDDAYNNIYSVLAKQNHVDLKRRLQNKVDNGEKVKMIDIVEELNLLVPAIRLAKTMSGVAI